MDKKKIKEIGLAGLFYVSARTLDSILTACSANQNGTAVEGNPITKYFMDSFGVNEGMALNSATELAVILPIAYRKHRILYVSSKKMLYVLGTFHLIGAATHIPHI